MIKKCIPLLLIALFFLGACEKKELEPSKKESGPSLFITGNWTDSTFYYGAGEDSVILEPDYSEFQSMDTMRAWASPFIRSGKLKVMVQFIRIIDSEETLLTDLKKAIEVRQYNYHGVPIPFEKIAKVDLSIIGADGGIHFSSLIQQPPDSYFEIRSLEERVENGLTYLQANVRFRCLVVSDLTFGVSEIKEGEGVIVLGGI